MRLTITNQFQTFLSSIGLPLEELLERAAIPNLLWKEELLVTEQEYYRLFSEVGAVISDEQLLAFSDVQTISSFMPPIYGALSAQNGLEALRRLAVYKKLIGPVSIQIDELADTVEVRLAFSLSDQKLSRFLLLYEQMLLISLLRVGTGTRLAPIKLAGPFEYGQVLDDYLGIVAEKQTQNSITFRRKDLAMVFLTQNNSMWQYLEPELKKRVERLSNQGSLVSHVQGALYQSVPSGLFSIGEIARSLNISTRTLQRSLNANQTSFKQQVQHVQQTLACHYLTNQQLMITEIAYLVGYTDASSFSRAFKRWTGQTVTGYRQSINH